jgi:SOS-response transcriptional repressor LexA
MPWQQIMKIDENLKKLIKNHNLNALELSRRTGIGQPVIYRLLTGETDDPKLSTVLTLANYFGITVNQLVGEMPFENFHSNNKNPVYFDVPLLTWEQAANWTHLLENIPHNSAKIIIDFKPISRLYALKVEDDSMSPGFTKETLLIIDGDKKPSDGSYIIVKKGTNDGMLFRQLLIDDQAQYLKPLNPDANKHKISLFDKRKDQCCGVLVQAKTNYTEALG